MGNYAMFLFSNHIYPHIPVEKNRNLFKTILLYFHFKKAHDMQINKAD